MISPGIIFDNTNNYGIVKTQTVFGFSPKQDRFIDINSTLPLGWLISHGDFGRSFTDISTQQQQKHSSKNKKSLGKGPHKKKHSKIKKCIYKLLKRKKKKSKHLNKIKKYLVPLIIGLLAAKSLVIPIALKTLAIMSIKALLFLSILKLIK